MILGQVPLALLVPNLNTNLVDTDIIRETIEVVRNRIGAVANLQLAIIVNGLPKTRSGKVARNSVAAMANGRPFKVPVTLEDPTVFDPIYNEFVRIGLKPSKPDDP